MRIQIWNDSARFRGAGNKANPLQPAHRAMGFSGIFGDSRAYRTLGHASLQTLTQHPALTTLGDSRAGQILLIALAFANPGVPVKTDSPRIQRPNHCVAAVFRLQAFDRARPLYLAARVPSLIGPPGTGGTHLRHDRMRGNFCTTWFSI